MVTSGAYLRRKLANLHPIGSLVEWSTFITPLFG
jgi:hypothetical protein